MPETSETTPESLLGYTLGIEEMKHLFDEQGKMVEASKSTAQQILGAASLIIALIGILPISIGPSISGRSPWFIGIIAVIALLYLGLIGLCMQVLRMSDFAMPIRSDWDTIYYALGQHTNEMELRKKYLMIYVETINMNRSGVARRIKKANLAATMLPIIVILLFAACFIP